ncbi:tRNA (cytidine(34)-2'-O)-methyltransferase [Acidobacteria bacterium AH-259-G07]|nr:tRNA (cytidine(34)-2'-O)-methyltransferase [Acidobacteria bacterium AH-259-G07]MDA2938832.1 tRNA (cytidine(34)-2'-O)-methyltransferase [Acidobacteria bacterium AH-259-A15]
MHVVLVEPQIPPNTGNVARLCAATQIPLHLVGRLGFRITDRHLKRAGLDYWDCVQIHRHKSIRQFLGGIPPSCLFFFSKKGQESYVNAAFQENDFLVFGSETKGLPAWIFERYPQRIWRIPIFHPEVRSLNLASAVSIVVYEALRQIGKLQEQEK